jgi:EmrB/QacA subfamily drug resistance transporter
MSIGPSRRITSSPNYKYWAYFAIAIGMFLTVMDQSGVNITIPLIAEDFGASIPTAQWITLSYILSTSAMLMPMGRLSDMLGRKRVYVMGFFIFMGAAALGGSAQSFEMIVVAKVIQGIGAAGVQANGMAMITEVFSDRERGKAIGLHTAVIGTGSVSGPVIGGFLASAFDWRAVFFASVPVGMIATLAVLTVLKPAQVRGQGKLRFDWAGAALSSGALISFLLAMTNAYRVGWTAPPILAGFMLAAALMAAFIWWERRTLDPMLELAFFRSRVFSLSVTARCLSFLGISSVFFLMPFYLIQVLGYTPSRAAFLMIPSSLCMAFLGPLAGRLSDKLGTRWLATLGMAFSASAMFTLSRLTTDSPPMHVIIGMVLSGCGMGLFNSPNTSATMSSVGRPKYGIASAFLNVVRTSSNVTGVALATTIVTLTMASMGYEPNLGAVASEGGEGVKAAFVSGFNKAFMVSGSLVLLAMALSAVRSEPKQAEAPTREPAAQPRPSSSGGKD